jgi:alginate O-acetyltransferase complex protein AlgI
LPFDSIRYGLFLPAVTVAYFGCPQRLRWLFLLAASYYFYGSANAGLSVALVASTLLTYLSARRMADASADMDRRHWMILGVAGNLGLLIVFKYLSPFTGILAPIGISFFTLQAIGYLLDILRGERQPEAHVGYFAAYMAFFPHVVAGPIAQSTHLLPQFRETHAPDYERLGRGMRQIMWGLFQKLVVADNLGMFVDSVYGDIRLYSGSTLMIATLFFSVQLYSDFAGYSNIALGSARLMGFELLPNFDRPYLAGNLAEFWRRWHISLSRWLAGNIHKPVAVMLRANPKTGVVVSIMTTFVLCGLWHGASWNYLCWGLLHGAGLSALALTGHNRKRLQRRVPAVAYSVASMIATFSFVSFAWVFFRADNLSDAIYAVRHLGVIDFGTLIGVPTISHATVLKDVAFVFVAVLGDLLAPMAGRAIVRLGPSLSNYFCIVIFGFCIYVFGVFEKQTFIYSQF